MGILDSARRTMALGASAAGPLAPYELAAWPIAATPLDVLHEKALAARRLTPARPCSDEVYLRRVFIDLLGTLPKPDEVNAFAQDKRSDRRARLVDALLTRPEFADYWAMRWGDTLRIKAEFPINLWPNAVQAYHRWVRDQVESNRPFDQVVTELLTANGSNFRVAPANFYRAIQTRDANGIAEAVALTWMGTRLDKWPAAKRTDLARFFSRLIFKKTEEWKEEIVCLDPTIVEPLDVTYPDGKSERIAAGADPRRAFAAWLTAPTNPYFARSLANRMWAWLFGRGIVHETDDIRPDNPPALPEVLSYLEAELVKARFDLRALIKIIVGSRCYQQSAIAQSTAPGAEALFAAYPVRRLDAEVLCDALLAITGQTDSYSSQVPEPFTWMPENQRAVALGDGSITSSFLEMFGRPPRDTGLDSERNNQPTDSQRLYMLNSGDLQRRLESSPQLRSLGLTSRGNRATMVRGLYVLILSRQPTDAELAAAGRYTGAPFQAGLDMAWALLNTKEFLYRH